MFVWEEAKRESNLRKYGLDFRDAYLVFDNPEKCTNVSPRPDETRWMDLRWQWFMAGYLR